MKKKTYLKTIFDEVTNKQETITVLPAKEFLNVRTEELFSHTIDELLGFIALVCTTQGIYFKVTRRGIEFKNEHHCNKMVKILSNSINYN